MTTPTSLVLVVLCAILVATGVYLILERALSRIIIGFACLANGVNLALLIAGGAAGAPPIVGKTGGEAMSDPLAQAMMLTAIVITLGTTAFLLALAYRAWQLDGTDDVQDDLEDRQLAARAAAHERLHRDHDGTVDDDAASSRDETDDPDTTAVDISEVSA